MEVEALEISDVINSDPGRLSRVDTQRIPEAAQFLPEIFGITTAETLEIVRKFDELRHCHKRLGNPLPHRKRVDVRLTGFQSPKTMPSKSGDPTAKVPLFVLGAVCFITVFMCQTRFKIAKEIKPEVTPPLLKNNYVSMIYGFGKPDRFRLVLRTFVVVTSPFLALLSTGLLLFGKLKLNPYLFLPWLFVTVKGLLFIQTKNMVGILKELFSRYDQTYAFCLEDWKWSCLYFTILFFIKSFAVYEVFEIFRTVWNNQYDDTLEEPVKLEASELEKNSMTSMRSISSICSRINEYHTVTSICKFGLFSDQQPSDKSPSKLKSLVALFRKEN